MASTGLVLRWQTLLMVMYEKEERKVVRSDSIEHRQHWVLGVVIF